MSERKKERKKERDSMCVREKKREVVREKGNEMDRFVPAKDLITLPSLNVEQRTNFQPKSNLGKFHSNDNVNDVNGDSCFGGLFVSFDLFNPSLLFLTEKSFCCHWGPNPQ